MKEIDTSVIEKELGEAELLNRYPLSVHFPTLSGQKYMLTLSTHWLGTGMILGNSPESLTNSFEWLIKSGEKVVIDHHEAKPLALYRLNIVRPNHVIELIHAKRRLKAELEDMAFWVSAKLRHLKSHPREVSECDDVFQDDHDIICNECYHDYIYDLEKIYRTKRDLFLEDNAVNKSVNKVSSAPPQNGERPLYKVQSQTHWNKYMFEVNTPVETNLSGALFFCHREVLEIPQKCIDLHSQGLENKKAAAKKKKIIDSLEGTKLRQEHRRLVEKIFE